MKRIDEKIDNYLNEGSIPLRMMNYASDIGKFMIILNNLHNDILSIKTKEFPYDEEDSLTDALEEAHMKLFFIKKQIIELNKKTTQTVGGKKLIGK